MHLEAVVECTCDGPGHGEHIALHDESSAQVQRVRKSTETKNSVDFLIGLLVVVGSDVSTNVLLWGWVDKTGRASDFDADDPGSNPRFDTFF